MDEKELRQLALDVAENKVFGTFHLREHEQGLVGNIFMPILFMDEKQHKDMKEKDIFHIYEYNTEAGPRSVNGCPIFFSMRMISKKDWIQCVKYIEQYRARKESFLNKTEEKTKEPEEKTLFEEEKND